MCTLYESGVPFRTIVHEDGTIERWQQPELPAWEVPKRDPHERRPRAPDWGPGGGTGGGYRAEVSGGSGVMHPSEPRPTRRTWRRGDGRRGSGGCRVNRTPARPSLANSNIGQAKNQENLEKKIRPP
jgi:hypothetical protein